MYVLLFFSIQIYIDKSVPGTNKYRVSYSMKQWVPLMGFKLTPDKTSTNGESRCANHCSMPPPQSYTRIFKYSFGLRISWTKQWLYFEKFHCILNENIKNH